MFMHIVYYFKQFENNAIFIHCRTVIQGLLSTMSVFAGRHINVFFFFQYSIFYLFFLVITHSRTVIQPHGGGIVQ